MSEQITPAGMARVGIVHDSGWGGRGRSFDFKDPACNLVEIADCDF